jgi:hypothetical protein
MPVPTSFLGVPHTRLVATSLNKLFTILKPVLPVMAVGLRRRLVDWSVEDLIAVGGWNQLFGQVAQI